MYRRKLDQTDIFLIIANLFPVFGVWFLGWNATEAFTVYAMETLIVGMMTILKMFVATLARGRDEWYNHETTTMKSGFFFIVFFTLHFGIFALVQTSIFSQTAGITQKGKGMTHFFFHWYEYITPEISYMLLAFLIGYIAKSFIPFLLSGDFRRQPMMLMMFQPYGRIFIQQFTVILGSMFLSLGLGKVFVLVFVLAKIVFENVIDFDKVLRVSTEEMKKKNSPQQ